MLPRAAQVPGIRHAVIEALATPRCNAFDLRPTMRAIFAATVLVLTLLITSAVLVPTR
jgi:hypothetical protein